jgi:hypothetical protein
LFLGKINRGDSYVVHHYRRTPEWDMWVREVILWWSGFVRKRTVGGVFWAKKVRMYECCLGVFRRRL